MSKSDTKKTGKTRIPKRIGGVKLPKELRRSGEALIDSVVGKGEALLAQANTPAGREMLAAGLTMAAAAATAAIAKKAQEKAAEKASTPEPAATAAAPPPPSPPPPPPPPPEGVQRAPDPQAIAEAFGQAAEQVLGRFFGKRA